MKENEKVTQFIFIPVTIMVLLLPYSYQTPEHVVTCPSNEQSWANRSRHFQCKRPLEDYHCLQNSDHTLIETCLKVYSIPFYKDGCPWVKVYNGKPILGNPFNPCDPTHTGCPSTYHEVYKTNELYKYPACIQSSNGTTSHRIETVTEITSTTSTSSNNDVDNGAPLLYIGILLGCLVLMACAVLALLLAKRTKLGRHYKDGLKIHEGNYNEVSTKEEHQMTSTVNTGKDIRVQEERNGHLKPFVTGQQDESQ